MKSDSMRLVGVSVLRAAALVMGVCAFANAAFWMIAAYGTGGESGWKVASGALSAPSRGMAELTQ